VGSLAVSTLLIGGAIGIGWHSFDLMMGVVQSSGVQETASAVVATASDPSTSPASPAAQEVASISDHHGHTLNPNAAWFALISIVVKEWLYRASKNPFLFVFAKFKTMFTKTKTFSYQSRPRGKE
jgi:divalent metal cation (Fe/Co/Zn/Cd) transporter